MVTDDEIVSVTYVLLNAKDSSVLDTNYGKQNLGAQPRDRRACCPA